MDVETVLCFDRDYTVDVNPHPDRRAVPLAWVKHFAHECAGVDVWATGNQSLVGEARIPGVKLAKRYWDEYQLPLNDVTDESVGDYRPKRVERLRLIKDLYEVPNPSADIDFVVIDDIDLRELEREGWTHYYPWEFVEAVENGDAPVSVPSDISHSGKPFEKAFSARHVSGDLGSHYRPETSRSEE